MNHKINKERQFISESEGFRALLLQFQKLIIVISLIFCCSFLVFPTLAHAVSVRAFVDRNHVTLGESLQLTISVKGGSGDADITPIRDFKVVSRGTSTSINYVNGQMSREVLYNYALIPLKEGRLRIPPLTVKSDGKNFRTREISIQVSKRAQSNAQNRDVFVEARISNPNPYEGEQIIYTFRFYRAVQIARGANFQKPDFTAFTAKSVEDEKSYETVSGGRKYHVTELTYVLLPLKAGARVIEPAILECGVVLRSQRRSRSLFDSFFNDNTNLDHRILRTESVKVNVKPLPPYEGDGNFSGLVGQFGIRTDLESASLKIGDSTTLSVTLQGTGNIMDAASPEINVPDAFKVYKDNPEDDIRLSSQGYKGKKIFRTALVPIQEGNYSLDPIRLVYFDVSQGRYVTRSTKPLSLSVSPSDKKDTLEVFSAPASDKKAMKKKVEFTGRDILPLKENLDALEAQVPLSLTRFVLFLLGPLIACLVIRTALLSTQKHDDPATVMAKKAEKALNDACRTDASGEEFLSCLHKSLISVILSKAGAKGESLTYAEAEEILHSQGYPEEAVKSATSLLEKIDSAQYSGLSMDADFREDLLGETKQMVGKLGDRK